jgi:CheY-like chemotaxis protein
LVVEHNPVLCSLFSSVIEEEGHLAVKATDKREALRLATEMRVDLFVCDLHLPGANGVEVLHEFHQVCPRVPVLAISGLPRGVDVLRATRVLRKPFGRAELRALLRELLDEG